jgi:hypothetical protein
MSRGLELFSIEVSAARPKVIARVPPNELYLVIISLKPTGLVELTFIIVKKCLKIKYIK